MWNSSTVKFIAAYAPTFFEHIISVLAMVYGHRCLKIRMLSQNKFQLILEVVDHEVYTALKRGWQKCMHFWVQVLFNKLLCNFESADADTSASDLSDISNFIRMVLRKQFYPIVNSDW